MGEFNRGLGGLYQGVGVGKGGNIKRQLVGFQREKNEMQKEKRKSETLKKHCDREIRGEI